KQRLLASFLLPLTKPGRAADDVRPIAIGEVFVKLAAHYTMTLIQDKLPSLFPRIQFGVSRPGGSEAAAQLTRAVLTESSTRHPTTIALATDFRNAFNSSNRARTWRAMLDRPDTEPVWRMFHWAYSQPSDLLVYDNSRLRAV